MNVGVRVEHDQFRRAMDMLVRSTREGIKREINRATKGTASKARQNAPHASGQLKGSIQEEYAKPDHLEGIVRIGAHYGQFVEGVHHNYEMGRAPGKMPPRDPILQWVVLRGLPLKWFGKETESTRNQAAFLVQRKIARRGTPAQPFLKPAADIERQIFEKNMKRIIEQAAREAQVLVRRGG